MIDELITASNLLCAATDRYYTACIAIQKSYSRGDKPHTTVPQLLLRMDTEIELATSLELRLGQAKAAINWSKNYTHMPAAINNLPSELLVYIFHLVLGPQRCAKRDYSGADQMKRPAYPAALAWVCSRWRGVAFKTPTLWSHIDISTSTLLNQLHLNCLVELHLTHAGHTPLDLHIFDPQGYSLSYLDSIKSLHESIKKLASRTSSFNLDARYTYDPDFHGPILSAFLKGSTHGQLKRLIIRHDHDYNSGFIRASDDPEDSGLDIGLLKEQFENILSSISILHLDRLYPQWNSQAYHGLVELRLNGMYSSINESDLIGILRSSPALRILELGLDIEEPLPIDIPVTAIPLNNLEALNLTQLLCTNLAIFLRWLAPGPKPLQLAIQQGAYELLGLKESLESFFLRSSVDRVYGKGLEFSLLIELLAQLPSLRELVISCARFQLPFPLQEEEKVGMVLNGYLENLCIIHSSVDIEDILFLIGIPTFIVRTVAFHWCTFFRDGVEVPRDQESFILEELHQSHPGVVFIIQRSEEPNPAKNWDLFAWYDDA